MDDFDVNIDEGIQNLNIDDINISNDIISDGNDMLGIDLLVDPNKVKSPTSNSHQEKYIFTGNVNKEIDLDDDIIIDTIEDDIRQDSKSIPLSDPLIDNIIEDDDDEFVPIHKMTSQDIKNEKIDLIYKFKKLETQGIRTTMNYNMNSHLDDMRNEYTKLIETPLRP